jgi:hypothetical protein
MPELNVPVVSEVEAIIHQVERLLNILFGNK